MNRDTYHSIRLRVIDVSDPSNPFEAGFYDNVDNTHNLAVSSNLAYVTDYRAGFLIIENDLLTVAVETSPLPNTRVLQNVPNPFNPSTSINYELSEQSYITLRIFDLTGRLVDVLVEGETQSVGTHTATWTGRDSQGRAMPSGTDFYRLEAGGYTETKRMTLIR